jgi:hypothetical protein
MTTTYITPLLPVTTTMFETARVGIAQHAPGLPSLTWDRFTDTTQWTLIPDDRGALSKAETTLLRTKFRTVRLNIWFRADLRGGDKPMPHSHPWESFTAHVLAHGYTEDRYDVTEHGLAVPTYGVTHESPGTNRVDHATYHEVTEVHEPGATLSLMVCGAGRRGDWGSGCGQRATPAGAARSRLHRDAARAQSAPGRAVTVTCS